MADILAVATREFAEKGLAGARIDDIAEAMRTSKRMIYYYFGSKEGLYIRGAGRGLPPHAQRRDRPAPGRPAARRRAAQAGRLHRRLPAANPDFIRLVMTENIHRGEYLASSRSSRALNVPAIEGLRRSTSAA
jgi:AcrR family transcriptional regulator